MNVAQGGKPSLEDLGLEGAREPVARRALSFMEEYAPRPKPPVQVVAPVRKPKPVEETRREPDGQSYSLNTIFGGG